MENETVQKPKIEAIYPLTAMQQNLLFHHLMEGEDQGFLLVQCLLEGELDINTFKSAWELTIQRHEMLRASIHWKKVKQPLMVISPQKKVNLIELDWSDKNDTQQEQLLIQYKSDRKNNPVALDKDPLSNVSIIKAAPNRYHFIWDCHHIFLDGWSSTTILKDVFSFYKSLVNKQEVQLPNIPTFKVYKNWKDKLSKDQPQQFWKNAFDGFSTISRFPESVSGITSNSIKKLEHSFSKEDTLKLKALAKQYKVTLNTFFQSLWSLVLAKYFEQDDVVFGTTVSGRSVAFPSIEDMVGMFTNVLPVRVNMSSKNSLQEVLQTLQLHQMEARNFEYVSTNEILSWGGISEGKTPYNSLFVFENFPYENIGQDIINVSNFKSGVTTTYPVSIIFKVEDHIEYDLFFNSSSIDNSIAEWLNNNLQLLCNILISQPESNIKEVLEQLQVPKKVEVTNNILSSNSSTKKEENYLPPRNHTELQLLEIWEQLFMTNYIGVNDNFFDLGGKSLLSVKMFTLIEKQMNIKLSPTTILEHPTIADLANLIDNHNEDELKTPWKFLVPIKARGDKHPLFCIHAGGGHVFFFKDLAQNIDKQRPVYALQPIGIYGEDNMHQDIETMAKDYADEISLAQPEGVLNIIVYCFSTAVGIEMASYLKKKGRKTNIIVADTIAEHRLLLDKARFKVRLYLFLKRLMKRPFKTLKGMIGHRIFFYLNPLKVKLFGTNAEKNTEQMRLHLVDLFGKYNWQTKIDKLSLILTEKIAPEYNEATVNSWKPLVKQDINIINCEADHVKFFELPDVQNTAKAIEEAII